ncbi:general secretion pathway protein GspC [Paraburkholderia kururiensis]|uniref:General secretion pathway protein GspC n=1 Tax=Paraburkholderia kururiensis TaxID=984307 RepID=A0ABZ0WRE1_9BURK|nr:general secretion pathway protein GspC [Paraburkholderia kururiensis]WQD79942.1 hypothetical protein U0042_09820 [Paraburkholderia kururiensis]
MIRLPLNRRAVAPMLATAAAAALFIAVVLGWARVFSAPAPAAPATPPPPAPLDVSAGTTLFGASPDADTHNTIQLLGILSFDAHHAAAIVSLGGDAARVVRLGGALGNAVKLAEVHARSIVVESNGLQREIRLPDAQSPSAFVR